MLRRRFIGAIPVLLGISLLVFFLMHIAPGDPISLLLGDDATEAEIQRTRNEWGLDQPILVQYWEFLSHAVRGDFGKSLKFGEPVTKLVFERLPATCELALSSLLVAILISIPIGVYSAIKHDSPFCFSGVGGGWGGWGPSLRPPPPPRLPPGCPPPPPTPSALVGGGGGVVGVGGAPPQPHPPPPHKQKGGVV